MPNSEIEKLGVREVVLLLDFDRRGKEGTLSLKTGFGASENQGEHAVLAGFGSVDWQRHQMH